MIGALSYEEVLKVKEELLASCDSLRDILKDKNIQEMDEFVSTVDGYSKYLETTVSLYQDADKALMELTENKN